MGIPAGFGIRNSQEQPEIPAQNSSAKISKSEQQAIARTQRLAARSLKSEPLSYSGFNFPAFPLDLQVMIINKLDPCTQQSLRETGATMNREVTKTIHQYDIAQLVSFTNFLAAKLENTSFATPKESKDAILASSLKTRNEALYKERNRIVNKLVHLGNTQLDQLAQEYKNPIYPLLPAKFEKIFEIAKMLTESFLLNDLMELDCYEYLRYLEEEADDDVELVGEIVEILLTDDLSAPDSKMVLSWDQDIFNYMERILNRESDETEKNRLLTRLTAGIARTQIAKEKPEFALKEIAKFSMLLEQYEPSKELSISQAHSNHLWILANPICSSTIDEASARKIFALYEQSAQKIPDEIERTDALHKVKILEAAITLVKEWSLNQLEATLQLLNTAKFPHVLHNNIKAMLERASKKLTPKERMGYFTRCIKQLEAAQDTYTKSSILIYLYRQTGDLVKANELTDQANHLWYQRNAQGTQQNKWLLNL